MSDLLRTIMALAHDGFEVAFTEEGYNCNMVILRKKEDGATKERKVALPDSHLNDNDMAHYLKVMSQDPTFMQ